MKTNKPKKTRSFSDVFSKYKHYDPATGSGNESDWRSAFNERMGYTEAKTRVGADDPLGILGLTVLPGTLDELRRVYRKVMVKISHCFLASASQEDQETAKKFIAAFTVLEKRYA